MDLERLNYWCYSWEEWRSDKSSNVPSVYPHTCTIILLLEVVPGAQRLHGSTKKTPLSKPPVRNVSLTKESSIWNLGWLQSSQQYARLHDSWYLGVQYVPIRTYQFFWEKPWVRWARRYYCAFYLFLVFCRRHNVVWRMSERFENGRKILCYNCRQSQSYFYNTRRRRHLSLPLSLSSTPSIHHRPYYQRRVNHERKSTK